MSAEAVDGHDRVWIGRLLPPPDRYAGDSEDFRSAVISLKPSMGSFEYVRRGSGKALVARERVDVIVEVAASAHACPPAADDEECDRKCAECWKAYLTGSDEHGERV